MIKVRDTVSSSEGGSEKPGSKPHGFSGYCSYCGAWEYNRELKPSQLGVVVPSKIRYGFCKARPPVSDRSGTKGYFPVMPENEWCVGFVEEDESRLRVP